MESSKPGTGMMGSEHAIPTEEELADGKLVDKLEVQQPLGALASRCFQPTQTSGDAVDAWG